MCFYQIKQAGTQSEKISMVFSPFCCDSSDAATDSFVLIK